MLIEWIDVTLPNTKWNFEVGVDMCRTVCTYGLAKENTIEEREKLRFEVGEVLAGSERVESGRMNFERTMRTGW